MDERSIPSTAIYRGNLARTFEYRTTGVHATPHLHWSFSLQEGATISCPVLVAQNVVYVGDSAGFFSALDARSGDLLWRFATDWAQNEENDEDDLDIEEIPGVTAFCLAGRLAYVASACQTLYEVDLSNGQVIRSWDHEALEIFGDDITSLLFYDQRILFNNREDCFSRLDPATGSIDHELFCCGDPIMYRHPGGDSDAIYGFGYVPSDHIPPFPPYQIYLAINILEDSPLWYMYEEDGREDVYYGFTMMDDTLYVVYSRPSVLDDVDTPMFIALLALDPFTGAEQWRYTSSWDEDCFQLAAASHLIFLVARKGIEAIDTHTHQPRWKWTSNSDNRHALVADGLLFVLDETGQITALDASTGQPRWSWQAEQPIRGRFGLFSGRFCTIAEATLYLVMDHTLCAFR